MDISILNEKPKYRKEIITLIKPESKISEVLPLIKREIKLNYQVFWVCPLIKESQILDYSSVKLRFEWLKKKFPNEVNFLHGELKQYEKISPCGLDYSKISKLSNFKRNSSS